MFDILFKNICVVNPEVDCPVIANAYVGVRDGKIAYLSQTEPQDIAARVIDGTDKALIPGLVNTHTHVAMSVLRGYADDHNLQDWLHNYVFPAEAKLDEECVYVGTQLAIAEMIRTGTVSITDMYMYIPAVAKAAYETGIYANITNAALVFDRDGYRMEKDNSYIQMEQLRRDWHNIDNGRIKLDSGIHAEYTSFERVMTRYNNPNGLIANTYYKGAKVGEIWGYTIEGLFQSEEEITEHADQSYMKTSQSQKVWLPGDMKYKDLDGNKKINDGKKTVSDPGDMSVIGNTTPRWRYGINLSANWNGFFLTAMLQGVGKRDWYPSVECNAFWGMYNRPYNMLPTHVYENQWTEDNPDGYFPRLRGYLATSSNGVLRMPNTRYLQNAAYIRLKNLSFGYEFPSAWLEKARISKLSIYFSGQNLWTWSPIHRITRNIDPEVISGSDTEVATGKGDSNAYPMLKNFTLGLTIGF